MDVSVALLQHVQLLVVVGRGLVQGVGDLNVEDGPCCLIKLSSSTRRRDSPETSVFYV